LLFFLARGLKDFKDLHKAPLLGGIIKVEQAIETPIRDALKAQVPTNFRGKDVAGVYIILIALAFLAVFTQIGAKLHTAVQRERRRLSKSAEGVSESLKKSLKAVADGRVLERDKLLELYAHTKKSLESGKSLLSFLSVDIVNSTGMKIGEEAAVAERDFRQYKTMVEKILKRNHPLKEAWTPDGIMICFGDTRSAVMAGMDILVELERFNREIKAIKHDFAVRVGINSGEVMFDEAMPMEEMSDRVIDIAGHMQKHCAPGSVWISEHAIQPLVSKELPFKKNGEVVDGCPVYEWNPEMGREEVEV
jgi:class 3 adenylate cyclase